jgi:hypothetical protein
LSVFTLSLLIAIASSGCGDDKPAAQPGHKSTGTQAASGRPTESPCEGTLSTIDEVFKLSKLGRTTTIGDGVLRLNDWQRTCAPTETPAPLPPEIEKLLTESQRKFLDEKRFLQRDGEHLRDCLLDRAVSTYAPGSTGTELERVTHLFEHIVRAIGLVPKPPQNLPLTPYEVYLLGKGTAEDRAWVFINVLKQLRIDAVLVLPHAEGEQSASASAETPFLAGVLLDGQVYLFDSRAGVPIPARPGQAKSGTIPRPATLAEAAADAAVLKQLDAGNSQPYPIAAADLKQPEVAIVADAAFWSPRMIGLQAQFVGARALVIADPLADTADGAPGLYHRIAKAGGDFWDASRIRVWDFPEKRLVAHAQMTKDQQEILEEGQLGPFGAYKTIAVDARGQAALVDKEEHEDRAADGKLHPGVGIIKRTTAGAQMRARLDQLEGHFSQAVREYLEVRDKCRELLRFNIPIPEKFRHSRADEDATYWTALCQFEQGEFKSAINTLVYYRKRPDAKNWQRESRYLLAISHAADGNYPAAIAELEPVEPDDLEYAGYQYLIRQWQSASSATGH